MRALRLAVALGVAALATDTAAGNLYVPLTVVETAAVGRAASPVTSGIPLAAGRVRSDAALRVLDPSGRAVPAGFLPLATWPDGSWRWVLCDFQADLPASGSAVYALTADPFTPAPTPPPLSLTDTGSAIEVDTGVAHFRLTRSPLSIFEEVRVGGTPVSAPGADLVADSGGTTWTAAADPGATLEVEELNPLRAVVRASGSLSDAASSRLLDFSLRLHFYAGKSWVRLLVTVTNPNAAQHPGNVWDLGSAGSRDLEDLTLTLPVLSQPPLAWTLWSTAPPARGGDPATAPVVLYQESSGGARWDWPTHVNRANLVPMTQRGFRVDVNRSTVETGDRPQPVLDLSSPAGGVAAAVRWFWQNFPKALRAGPTGRIEIGLFPGEFPDPHEIQGGEAKTHEILLVWHAGSASTAAVDAQLADMAEPLRARPAFDELQRSRALALCGPRDPAAFPAWEGTVDYIAFDQGVRSFFTQREAIDEYGWRHFGEAFADHETSCGTQCWDCPVSHDNNQYDYDWAALLNWLRDGRAAWLALGEEGLRHLYDIDVYHTLLDTPAYNGGLFWHTTHDTDAYTSTHRSYSARMSSACTPFLSGGPAPGHLYTEGLLLWGWLSGDRRAFEIHDQLYRYLETRYGLDAPAAGSGYEPRAWANALRTAVAEQRRSANPSALALAARIVADSEAARNPGITGSGFGDAMLMVSLGRYLELKAERGESLDADALRARQSLGDYADRVLATWGPQQDVLDFRFSEALWSAYRWGPPGDPRRASWAQLARDFFTAGERTPWFNTYITNKGLAHTATNGQLHTYQERGRVPAPVGRLLASRQDADVQLSWTAVTSDIHGDPLGAASYAVHRSAGVPTRFSDRRRGTSGVPAFRAIGELSDPERLLFYQVRAVAEPGIEGY